MFARLWAGSDRAGKRVRVRKTDTVVEQVKKILQEADQRLILMVRS